MYVPHRMREPGELASDRLHHAGMRMPHTGYAKPCTEVDESISVGVPHVGCVGALPEDGREGLLAGDIARFDRGKALGEGARARAGNRRHECGGEGPKA